MIIQSYLNQADLLLQVIPHIATEKTLALKGGTAINLFLRDMPRLSVDLDLTYLPFDDRETALRDEVDSTGNGRRESYKHKPIPRMRNTMIAPGKGKSGDLIADTKIASRWHLP